MLMMIISLIYFSEREVYVLYGSQTGNAKSIAENLLRGLFREPDEFSLVNVCLQKNIQRHTYTQKYSFHSSYSSKFKTFTLRFNGKRVSCSLALSGPVQLTGTVPRDINLLSPCLS